MYIEEWVTIRYFSMILSHVCLFNSLSVKLTRSDIDMT